MYPCWTSSTTPVIVYTITATTLHMYMTVTYGTNISQNIFTFNDFHIGKIKIWIHIKLIIKLPNKIIQIAIIINISLILLIQPKDCHLLVNFIQKGFNVFINIYIVPPKNKQYISIQWYAQYCTAEAGSSP